MIRSRDLLGYLLGLLLLMVPVLSLQGCEEPPQKVQLQQGQGVIRSSQAYLDHFGEPPTPKAGEGYARVWYFPLREQPDSIVPFPLFLFQPQDHEKLILGQVMGVGRSVGAGSSLYSPFPDDVVFRGVRVSNDVAIVSLQIPGVEATDPELSLMASVIIAPLLQFDDVTHVKLRLNNEWWPKMPAEGFAQPLVPIREPSAPRLLGVMGNWSSEKGPLKEMLVNFDRPVTIDSIEISDSDGTRVQGDYFHSVFRMSVVVQPEDPQRFDEGTPLTIAWKVTDRKGRTAQGEDTRKVQRPPSPDDGR